MSKPEKVHKFISKDGSIRAASVVAPELILELQKINALSPLAVVTGGRAVIACALLASRQKEERISLHFDGNGPIGRIFVESNYDGKTRANIANPHVDLPLKDGGLDVSGAVGIGLLNVTSMSVYQKTPYRGTVIIKTGEIGSDVAFYLEQSHQIPSVVALGVHLSKDGMVNAAGGVLIELMPGYKEEVVAKLEENVKNAKPMSDMLMNGFDADALMAEYTKGIELSKLEHEHSLSYSCSCNEDRVKKSLLLLGEKDLEDLLKKEDEQTEVRCDFCGRKYFFSKQEIDLIKEEARKKSMH